MLYYPRFFVRIKKLMSQRDLSAWWHAILTGCGQDNPIASYLFVLSIEILILLIENSNAKLYTLIYVSTIPNDMYADNLLVYLKYKKYNTWTAIMKVYLTK